MKFRWSPKAVAERHKYLDKFIHSDPVIRDIHRLYQLLDGKSTALFTHVSIMIAACTFLAGAPTDNNIAAKILFLLSTLAYLLIAISLLKVVGFSMYDPQLPLPDADKIFGATDGDNEYSVENDEIFAKTREYFATSVWERGRIHKRALGITRGLTLFVVILLAGEVLLQLWSYDFHAIMTSSKPN